MTVLSEFAHCPRCGAPAPGTPAGTIPHAGIRPASPAGPFRCAACGFTLFSNAASAVAAIILRDDGRALFIRRARDPGQGRLGMPGGFVDPGENAEDALAREVREEVGLELTGVRYLSSHANEYLYAGVLYETLDLFFTARVDDPERAEAFDAVESVAWLDPLTMPLDEIAFDSMRAAIRVLRSRARYGEGTQGWRERQD